MHFNIDLSKMWKDNEKKKHKFAVKKEPEKSKREEWIPNVCFVRFSDIKKKKILVTNIAQE